MPKSPHFSPFFSPAMLTSEEKNPPNEVLLVYAGGLSRFLMDPFCGCGYTGLVICRCCGAYYPVWQNLHSVGTKQRHFFGFLK